jgi:hypothetical protein
VLQVITSTAKPGSFYVYSHWGRTGIHTLFGYISKTILLKETRQSLYHSALLLLLFSLISLFYFKIILPGKIGTKGQQKLDGPITEDAAIKV